MTDVTGTEPAPRPRRTAAPSRRNRPRRGRARPARARRAPRRARWRGSRPSSARRCSTSADVFGMPGRARPPRSTGDGRPRSPRARSSATTSRSSRASTGCRRPRRAATTAATRRHRCSRPETTYGAAGSDGRFQVFARVQSTSRHWGLTVKADVDERVDARAVVGARVPGRRLARARVLGDVRLRVRRPPGAAPPLPPVGVRGPPAAQGLPAAVAGREAVAGPGRRRAHARRRRRRRPPAMPATPQPRRAP